MKSSSTFSWVWIIHCGMKIENRTDAPTPEKSSNTMISTVELCCLQSWSISLFFDLWNLELRFHYQLSNVFPALKWHSKWIESETNSFSCSFRWINSDSCIPKSSTINMMMSWPSLALFWPKEYWMQVNVLKSSRLIYVFKQI